MGSGMLWIVFVVGGVGCYVCDGLCCNGVEFCVIWSCCGVWRCWYDVVCCWCGCLVWWCVLWCGYGILFVV